MDDNLAKYFWPVVVGGLAYGAAASRARGGWAPLAFAGVAAYAVNRAMKNEKDYLSIKLGGSPDVIPF